MKNIIFICGEKNEQFNNLKELKEYIIPNFESLSEEEIEKILYENIFGIRVMERLQIINTKKGVYGDDFELSNQVLDLDRGIIIDSIETYLLSLCKHRVITILEEKAHRELTKNINVEIQGEDNYIVVDYYADEILKAMVGE